MPDTPQTSSASDVLFKRMVVVLTALSLAATYGWLAGFVRQPNGDLIFHWHWLVLLWAVIGFASTAFFWRKIWPPQNRTATRKDIWIGTIVLLIPGLWWLIFPLRSISGENRWSVIAGLAIAAVVLSFGAWMVMRLGRAFEADEIAEEKKEHDEAAKS
jgi:hypothetical protein